MQDADRHLRRRLLNWARYVTVGHSGRPVLVIGSAEGRYQPERLRGDHAVDRRTPDGVPDVTDGELIDRAWRLMSNAQQKQMLKLYYVKNMPGPIVMRRMQLRRSDWRQHRYQAERALAAQLDRLEKLGVASRLSKFDSDLNDREATRRWVGSCA